MPHDARTTVSFGDLLEGGTRNGIYKSKEFHGRGCKIINMGEIFAHPRLAAVEMKRVELTDDERTRFGVLPGDLLFARRSLVADGAGKCSIVMSVDGPTVFESSIIRARVNPAHADSLFLYYLFASQYGAHLLDTIRRDAVVAGITGSDLVRLQFKLPLLVEQHAIAGALGTLDDKIDLNRRMNETLEAMAQTLFKSWFIDFDPVRAKMAGHDPTHMEAATADLFPAMLRDASLGRIPADWEVGRFGDIVDIIMGASPPGDTYNESGDGLPLINGPVEFGNYFPVRTKWTTKITRTCNTGDLILCVRGSTTGRHVIADGQYVLGRGVAALRAQDGNQWFAVFALREILSRLLLRTTGSVFPSLSRADMDSLEVVIPPQTLRHALHLLVEPLMQRVEGNVREMRMLAELRDLLLPKLISGELRVCDAEG